jgi:excinuclease ABC subunit A
MSRFDVEIRGAREHNLRDVSLRLPRGKLICMTGVSGSGKSSLAFDTLYAEGQRRYVESLSSYARQFLGKLPKPDVDRIDGLSPSIAIQQKTGGNNPRSTVGTITEINDFLRVLYARIGENRCPRCDRPVAALSREEIASRVLEIERGTKFAILAPIARGQKGEYKDVFASLARAGFVRARVDGQVIDLSDPPRLSRNVQHDIDVVIDRLKVDPESRSRISEGIETGLNIGEGAVIIAVQGAEDLMLSSRFACASCGIGFDEPSPQLYSFNSPRGMCMKCAGLGVSYNFDPELLIPDPDLSIWEGAIEPLGRVSEFGKWRKHIFEGLATNLAADPGGVDAKKLLKTPWRELPKPIRTAILEGTGDRKIVYHYKGGKGGWAHTEIWEGVLADLMRQYMSTSKSPRKAALDKYMRSGTCVECGGSRLNARARATRVGGKTLPEISAWPIAKFAQFMAALAGKPLNHCDLDPADLPAPLETTAAFIAEELIKELRARTGFLIDVGLDYLSLDRPAPTLSGGEAQRIRLAGQVGAGLVGVLYILDEPSIGLHPRDNERLLNTLKRLRDLGNTVVVVEHDEETMRAADHLVDFGPGPGVKGGEVVASGTLAEIAAEPRSLTGRYLSGDLKIAIPKVRRPAGDRKLTIVGARRHNLKNIDVDIPLGLLVCVTGVSGSGKSSLVTDILRDALARELNGAECEPGEHDRIEGVDLLDKIIDIDQSPIGRTPRSNPSTYTKLFDLIRNLYAELPDAKTRGYQAGRFSFNVEGGRCEACQGNGSNKLEMDFLADVWTTCPVCEGRRFNRETLHVRFKGKSINDVLNMDVQEALDHFANVPRIASMLRTLHDVGLDYIKLGQPSTTLSGGEAQRIKLARELVKRGTGKTLYILDEPTTGLHFADVGKLIDVLRGFTDQGNTVVVVEHNLDVIKTADWIIDLGPEGGEGGGRIVAEGTPEQIVKVEESRTGRALRSVLSAAKASKRKTTAKGSTNNRAKKASAINDPSLKEISIQGARQNNLKGVDVDIPRRSLTVCAGPSGSGKSSLAIDTLYAEGQRRYVESLSSYARQFLAPLPKPKVERITGLSPAICIEQKTTSHSPRSTVGTVTEIYDYIRILMARLGRGHCPACGIEIAARTTDEIVEKVLHLPEETRIYVMAPIESREGSTYEDLYNELKASGFTRVRVDGITYDVDKAPRSSRSGGRKIEVIVDRAIVRRSTRSRLADSIEAALDLGKGVAHVARVGEADDEARWHVSRFTRHRSCDRCRRDFEELSPHHFSFNSPLGWCPDCLGIGVRSGADPSSLIPDPTLSINQGAITCWPYLDDKNAMFRGMIQALAAATGIDLDVPYRDLPAAHRRAILYGTPNLKVQVPAGSSWPAFAFQYKGLFPAIEEASRVSYTYRNRLHGMVGEVECPTCMGSRLRDDAAAVRFHGHTIDQICAWPLDRAFAFFKNLDIKGDEKRIAGDLIREVVDRLTFLVEVGLEYLTLSRSTPTLSGGEAQRIRLASQIGSGLSGVLYVLDEPTIGLHPRDNARLLAALKRLRDLGNTLVVVEHDRDVIEAADHLIDFGPAAGVFGGEITAAARPGDVKKIEKSLTGRYLAGKESIPVPINRRPVDGQAIVVEGATHNNLKDITVRFPIGALTVVTGVSGSGKSTLVEDVLWKALAARIHLAKVVAGTHKAITFKNYINKVIRVDQSPIGSTPNSNPATYTGVFDLIRELFAKVPEARVKGFTTRRFSFNQPGGRCEACEGEGQKKVEMHFLPDVWVVCDVCQGKRYTADTLAITYRGKSIADVLDMTIDSALELFEAVPRIVKILRTLQDVGLGYVSLGQASPTLSGGEAQRVKLAAELARPDTGQTLYILDEPTTGLHVDDTRKLLAVLHRLADLGNTVVVIEHNLDVIKSADWIIDLGPEAGDAGGSVVATGSPETIAANPASITGRILAEVLKRDPRGARPVFNPLEATMRAIGTREEYPSRLGSNETPVVAPGSIAPNAKPPWQTDGRKWHTIDRTGRNGKPARWDGAIITRIVDYVTAAGDFKVDWSNQTIVRVTYNDEDRSPIFLEFGTGSEWIVKVRFYLHKKISDPRSFAERLGLAPFYKCRPPVASVEERVSVRPAGTKLHEIAFACHSVEDVSTDAFREFLDMAIEDYKLRTGRYGVDRARAYHQDSDDEAEDERAKPKKIKA